MVALRLNDPKEIVDLEGAWNKAQEISAAKNKRPAAPKTGAPEKLFE